MTSTAPFALPAGVAEVSFGEANGQAPNAMQVEQELSKPTKGMPSFASMSGQVIKADRAGQMGAVTQEWPAGQAGTYLAKAALERVGQSDKVAPSAQGQPSNQEVNAAMTSPKSLKGEVQDKRSGSVTGEMAAGPVRGGVESNVLAGERNKGEANLAPYQAGVAGGKPSPYLPTPPARDKSVDVGSQDMQPPTQREPQRAPLTSLNPDPQKLGIPVSNEGKPGRPNVPSPSSGGVEF